MRYKFGSTPSGSVLCVSLKPKQKQGSRPILYSMCKSFSSLQWKKRGVILANPAFFQNIKYKYKYQCGFQKLKVVTLSRTQNEDNISRAILNMAKKEHIALVCINLHFIIILEYRLKTEHCFYCIVEWFPKCTRCSWVKYVISNECLI